MSYTAIEPAAVKFYYEEKQVLQIYMQELRLVLDAASDVKIGVGITNPTTSFDIGNYIFFKNLKGTTEKTSFQLTNPGYNNEPYSFVPIGTIVIWGGETIPENWLECTGQPVLQASYPKLYAALGDTYTSTPTRSANISKVPEEKLFQVPDFRGGVCISSRSSPSQAVGTRYPAVPGVADRDVDIPYQYAPLRTSLIQQFTLASAQLPPHRHEMEVINRDINNVVITRYAMKAHRHKYEKAKNIGVVTSGGRDGMYYNNTSTDIYTGDGNLSHKHQVLNCRLIEAIKNPTNDPNNTTWNNPFNIEQQYIVMRYIIKAV